MHHGTSTTNSPSRSRSHKGLFGRLFSDLQPWQPPFTNPATTSNADADVLFRSIASDHMKELVGNDPSLDSKIPAGYTYFGQFVDHDITFDPTSSLSRQNDPDKIHNYRTPRLDLDNVYGSGPKATPYLYQIGNRGRHIGKFLIGGVSGTKELDLPRNKVGTALIGDPRNDENLMVSQIQLAFLKFHNKAYDVFINDGMSDDEAYTEARRVLTWTYQYIVWNDFVKRLISDQLWSSLLELENKNGGARWKLGNRFYCWKNSPFMPIEFSGAAYRFGHTMVRNGYRVNIETGPLIGDEVQIFSMTGSDLRGGRALPERRSIQWDWFLEFPSSIGDFPQRTRKFDPLLCKALASIPAGPGGDNALAFLNLKRGWRLGLPSGPDVAKFIGGSPIDTEPHEESLWFYCLKEARSLPGSDSGNKLGLVGGTIVGEVFAGLLHSDPNSYLNLNPNWTPLDEALLSGGFIGEDWQLRDIISFADMPVSASDIQNVIQPNNN